MAEIPVSESTSADPETDSAVSAPDWIVKVLGDHRYRDVRGDYEIKPYYRHFGCSCGWEQNISGMNGYWSWVAAHDAHVAEHLAIAATEAASTDQAAAASAALHLAVEEDSITIPDVLGYQVRAVTVEDLLARADAFQTVQTKKEAS